MSEPELYQIPHARGTWLDGTTGEAIPNADLLRRMARRQVVCLGETHDVAEIHRWQLHVAVGLHALRPNIALGFEMFPRRLQPVLDAWVAGEFDTATFLTQAEWGSVWGFHESLYLPLFHFCRQHRVRMLALNCHRPLVTRVGQEGWEAIPEAERDGMSPAAPATEGYREYLFRIMGGSRERKPAPFQSEERIQRFLRAQQTWDRAFACNIARVLAEPVAPLVIGIIGRGHLEFGHGTPFQLRDLGIKDCAVLLPGTADRLDLARDRGIADAIFRLDEPEPASTWRAPRPERASRLERAAS